MKWKIILLKYQWLLHQEEKEEANECDIFEIVSIIDHEENKTEVDNDDADQEDKVRIYWWYEQ